MSDLQWLWCYFNILEDDKEDELRWKSRLDYLGWWVNPQLAKSVMESENRNKEKSKSSFGEEPNPVWNDNGEVMEEGEMSVSTSFEDELKKALADAGIKEDFTELPDSKSVGDINESKDDFLTRVMANEGFIQNINQTTIDSLDSIIDESGVNPDDIDYFDFSE
jgi:hypothetical protein